MEDSFNYLVRMPMDSVTDENVEKIISDKKKMNDLYDTLAAMTEEQIWLSELSELRARYIEYIGDFRKPGTSIKIKEKGKGKVKAKEPKG
jgi:predicted transcriptional regulator